MLNLVQVLRVSLWEVCKIYLSCIKVNQLWKDISLKLQLGFEDSRSWTILVRITRLSGTLICVGYVTEKNLICSINIDCLSVLSKKGPGSSWARNNHVKYVQVLLQTYLTAITFRNLKPQSSVKRQVLHEHPERLKGYNTKFRQLLVPTPS